MNTQFRWTNLVYVKGKRYVNLVSPRTGRAYTVVGGPDVERRIKSRKDRDDLVKVSP